MNPSIEVNDLSKWYGEVIALNGINASLGPGVTGLLGPNGAGKTSFFRILTGLAKPSIGTVKILGESVHGNADLFKKIGFCPESDTFYEEMTGAEFLETLARVHGYSAREAKERSAAILERVGMSELGKKKVLAMSKGMRQRIKFAQALMHDPEVIFLDEPLLGMDPLLRHKTAEEIRRLGAAGKTVIVSSHILYEIELMTNNILLLTRGKVLAQGTIREIRDLLDKYPRKIIVDSSAPRAVAACLVNIENVVGVRIENDRRLLFESLKPELALRRLTAGAASGEFSIREISSADESLEAVFRLLVG